MKTRRLNKKIALIFAALVLVLLFAPTFVGAKERLEVKETEPKTLRIDQESEDNDSDSTDDSTKLEVKKESIRENRKEVVRQRLDSAKLKVCVDREAQVNTIMSRVVTRSQTHIDRITTVADKTKAYYESQGNTTDVYFGLVAAVETARQVAQVAVNSLSTDAVFSCKSDGPKSDIEDFHTQRLAKIAAVGAYKDTVKALIAAVKTAQPKPVTTEVQ